MWGHTVYQPIVFECRRLQNFYCIENSLHMKDIQPREGGGYITGA
jgi:hypothetical protein